MAAYAALRARGVTQDDAARQLGRDRRSAIRWEDSPEWPAAISLAIRELAASKTDALAPLLPKALERIAAALQSKSLAISVPAAWRVVEHIYGKAHQAVDVTSTSDISPELDALIRLKLGQPAIPGSVTIDSTAVHVPGSAEPSSE